MIWLERICSPRARRYGERLSMDRPAPTVTTVGFGGAGAGGGDWYWHQDERSQLMNQTSAKPPYRIPSMAEIAAIPPNGFAVISTFSGCGGSCLGFEMAGFRILWASEFIPAARDTYRANHPGVLLDGRDIRQVKPEEILAAIGKKAGEIDVLEGSPPCASFSTAGKREKGWGKIKAYSDTRQRTDDLFFEFARLLEGLRPRVFVAENVSGLVKGTAKGFFLKILAALKACGYSVRARVLDAQWLGVPQARQRLIFIGVRADLGAEPIFPKPLPYRYSVRDALPEIGKVRLVTAGNERHTLAGRRPTYGTDEPAPTILATEPRFNLIEPETDISRYAIAREWDRLRPGEKSQRYFSLARPALDAPCPTVTQTAGSNPSAAGVCHPTERRKFSIAELRRICGFPDDFILTGSYGQQWERLGRSVPPPMMRAVAEVIRDQILAKLSRTS